jgi:hypothetical protein
MFLLIGLIGCHKEETHPDDFQKIAVVEPSLSFDEYTRVKGSVSNTYTSSDLIQFLAHYGYETPDVLPAYNNYYQDINVGGSYLGNLTLFNGEPVIQSNLPQIDTLNLTFTWRLNDVIQCQEVNPRIWDLDDNLACDGVLVMSLNVKHEFYEWEFKRETLSYFGYNYIDDCICPECPPQFSVFYTFYPNDYEPYDYLIAHAKWDLNEDNIINIQDLIQFLANYG